MNAHDEGVGLCATCRHARTVPGARSTFYMCGRSVDDPRFRRYPPLPVLRCIGYEPAPPGEPSRRGGGSPSQGD